MAQTKKILVLGASGLIGRHVTDDLRARGFTAIGVARRFSSSQKASAFNLEMPLLALDSTALARLIAASGVAYAILRPGFVIAPSAYGGSAMVRALAALPLQLPATEALKPFQ